MKKLVLIIIYLLISTKLVFAGMSTSDIEKKLQRLEDDVEVMKQHFKTKKITVNGEIISDYGFFHTRGISGAYDILIGSITQNDNLHDLDLSSKLPSDTKAVLLKLQLEGGNIGDVMGFQETGGTNYGNIQYAIVTSTFLVACSLLVPCSSSQTISYICSNYDSDGGSHFTEIMIQIIGWFK